MDDDLDELRYHWGTAYSFSVANGKFLAQRRDTNEVLTSDSAEEMFNLLRTDYTQRPVPR